MFACSGLLLQGDSEINPVNFLQTGVATFVCPGNNRFILPRARRFAWAFVLMIPCKGETLLPSPLSVKL